MSSRTIALPVLAIGLVLPALIGSACVGSIDDDGAGAGGGGDVEPVCADRREFFALEVWPTLNAHCTSCHAPGGEASTGDNSKMKTAGFVLQWDTYPGFLDENITQLERMVTEQLGDDPKLLVKPIGGDNHLGGAVLDGDSPEYRALRQFVAMTKGEGPICPPSDDDILSTVPLRTWDETFRRSALTLGGRLPTSEELEAPIATEADFDEKLGALLDEEGFVSRVKTFFNDALLVEGGLRVQVGCFQFPRAEYARAEECQLGANAFCSGLTGTELSACTSAFNARWGAARRALTEEPLELIANVVRKKAPFTEVLTADYTMVNPYSAMLYGLEEDFDAPSAATYSDWKEARVTALVDGPFPHAGILSTPGFLGRWVSTATNRDRARARVVYGAFLATDVLTLAQRPVDTSALTAVANAPRNASACSACHAVVDPVANSFAAFADSASIDFDPNVTAATNRHQEMLPPGFGPESMPGQESELLQWTSDRITSDSRFALSITRIFFKGITGREPLRYPHGQPDSESQPRFVAWDAQDRFLKEVSQSFVDGGYDVRIIVSAIVKSPFFRAASVPEGFNHYLADSLGDGRLLTPEILSDKLVSVFGTHWGTWTGPTERRQLLLVDNEIFYGGIDSLSVTERLKEPNSLLSSVAARMANEMACRTVAWDFTRPEAQRLLFPLVDVASTPATDEPAIRQNIAYLIERLTGVVEPVNGVEVDAAFNLFQQTHAALETEGGIALNETCKGKWDRASTVGANCNPAGSDNCTSWSDAPLPQAERIEDDPNFTIRAWMAVVSYLMTDYRFLYQ